MSTLSIDTGSQMMFSPRNALALDPWGADVKAVEKLSLKERNAKARELRKSGRSVSTFALGSQLISLGGVGSGEAHTEHWIKVYGLNYR